MKKITEIAKEGHILFLKNELLKPIKNKGKYRIKEDKIVCFIDGKKIKKQSNKSWCYELLLNGFKTSDDENIKKCQLNKPIRYIINNIEFDKDIYINSYNNAEIIFKNCSFKGNIVINHATNIIFKNNKYLAKTVYDFPNGMIYNRFYISTRDISNVQNIKFIDDNLCLSTDKMHINVNNGNSLLYLDLLANKVEFINTNVSERSSALVETERLIIKDSKINSNEFYATTKIIKKENSVINIKNGVISEGNSLISDNISVLNTDYDGEKEKNKLQNQRNLLLHGLKQLKEECNNYISSKVVKVSDNIKKEQLKKVLK